MRKLILSMFLIIQMAYSDGIIEKMTNFMIKNYGDMSPKRFMIGDGTKVKIEENKIAYITNSAFKCNYTDAYLLGKPNDKCTVFDYKDKSRFSVSLILPDEQKILNELWTVNANDREQTMQVLRPNGFKIEIVQ